MELEKRSFPIHDGENPSTDGENSSLSCQKQAHQSSRDDDEYGGEWEEEQMMVSEEESSEPSREGWRRAGESSNEDGLDDGESDETRWKDQMERLDSFREDILKGREEAWESRVEARSVSRVSAIRPRRNEKVAHRST